MDLQWIEYSKIEAIFNTVSSIKFEPGSGQAYCYAVTQDGKVFRLLLSRIENNERLVMSAKEVQVDTCAYSQEGKIIADCGDPLYVLQNPNGFSLWQQWQERDWEEHASRETTKSSPRNVAHRGRV